MLLPYELCCFTYRASMQLESTHWVQYLVINTNGENDNTTGSNGHLHHLPLMNILMDDDLGKQLELNMHGNHKRIHSIN